MVVVLLTGVVFRDWNKTLYSAVTLYVSSVVVDKVLYGPDRSAVALIVSHQYKEIAEAVSHTLQRGATILPGQGSHTGQDRPVLLCAVRKTEAYRLRRLVYRIDPAAFVVVLSTDEVLGEGFKDSHKE